MINKVPVVQNCFRMMQLMPVKHSAGPKWLL